MPVAVHILLLGSLIFHPPKEFPDISLSVRPLANAKAQIVEMPKATAYLVSGEKGLYLEDRFDVFDLWRSDAVRACWLDAEGNHFSICRVPRMIPGDAGDVTRTRIDYSQRYSKAVLGEKDLDALDEAVYMLAPVEVERRVKPRRSQRRNFTQLWQYSVTNGNVYVYAFRPKAGKGQHTDWYVACLISADPEAETVIDSWLDDVQYLKPKTKSPVSKREKTPSAGETALLASDYRRSVINYSDWHFASASNVVVVDSMPDGARKDFLTSLTNGLPRMQLEYAKVLPSPLSDDSHIAAVRIFGSREEYLAYVGPEMQWSAALWSPQHRELVLHWPEEGSDALLQTVWHEALHQHLDYACSMIQSPAWFNEGHAVLFEHTRFDMDGNILFEPVPAAVAAIKANPAAIAEQLPALFDMDYADFYSGTTQERALKYHIAWSVAYFLQIGAPEVRFQPFKDLRSDLLHALVRTRSRSEASKAVLTGEMQKQLVAEWLYFWKRQ